MGSILIEPEYKLIEHRRKGWEVNWRRQLEDWLLVESLVFLRRAEIVLWVRENTFAKTSSLKWIPTKPREAKLSERLWDHDIVQSGKQLDDCICT